MDTSQDLRRTNLRRLLAELIEELGAERGAVAELARRSQVPHTQLSQFLNNRLHQGKKPRSLGDQQARKLERGMNKPRGWMDVSHDDHSAEDLALLDKIKRLTRNQRALLESQAEEFFRLNGPPQEGVSEAEQASGPRH